MDEQPKAATEGKAADASEQAITQPDLSFLWPAIDRIRAVEIRFQAYGDSEPAPGGKQPAADFTSRLTAVENELAALKQTIEDALGASKSDARQVHAVLPTQRWQRIAAGIVVAVLLLLLAHWLIVIVFDLHVLILRLASMVIPLPIALWLTRRHPIRPGIEIGIAIAIGMLAVFGMSCATSVVDKTALLPETPREWRETVEYIASISFSYVTGVLISSALQVRDAAHGRVGKLTLRLAKQVSLIQGLFNGLMLIGSAILSIVTGISSILK